jgi:serine/threonine protein phosphatase PrpC
MSAQPTCQGTTRAGTRCTRKVAGANKFCWQHAQKAKAQAVSKRRFNVGEAEYVNAEAKKRRNVPAFDYRLPPAVHRVGTPPGKRKHKHKHKKEHARAKVKEVPQEVVVCVRTEQNRRSAMEDTHVIGAALKMGTLYGVFDGHGGADVAKALVRDMPSAFSRVPKALVKQEDWKSVRKMLAHEFKQMDMTYARVATHVFPGSTACLVWHVAPELMLSVHVGDSRAVFIDADTFAILHATTDHKPSDSHEQRRVVKAGGFLSDTSAGVFVQDVMRVNGYLATSRAFGDADPQVRLKHNALGELDPLSAPVSVVPSLAAVHVPPNGMFIVMASDGLFDVVQNHQVCSVLQQSMSFHDRINKNRMCYVADRLVSMAMPGTEDNITVVCLYVPGPTT